MRRDRFAAPDGVAAFVGASLDVDRAAGAENAGQGLAHLSLKGQKPGLFRQNGDIDVHHALPGLAETIGDGLEEQAAVGVFPFRVGVGELLSDVAPGHGAEDCIDDGMNDHVAVAVGDGAELIRHDHPADQQLAAGLELVNVVAVADAEGDGRDRCG